jgi:tetratricopeptide (TPR) repeat protein
MRYADFLILAKEYKALEQEAQEMSKLDKSNPRIFRYLGYSAYENGNFQGSVQALKDFMTKVEPERVIARDYLYLGRAQLKAGQDSAGIGTLRKAIELDSSSIEGMSEVGRLLYDAKKYAEAAAAYELAVTSPKLNLQDYYFLGASYYWFYNTQRSAKKNPDKDILVKADSAFSKLAQRAPTTEQAWQFRGRINRAMDDEEDSQGLAYPFYEKYVEVVTVTKPEKVAKNTAGLVEAYSYLGLVEAKKNKNNTKALEYFNKGLALAPTDANLVQYKKAVTPGK